VTAQPTGTVTLLFTDVEGSTRLLHQLGTERFAEALELHRRLLREPFQANRGFEFGTEGDAFFVAFARAEDAVAAAAAGQRALTEAQWPDGAEMRVRIGIHTGEPMPVETNYVGMDLHRVARIMSAGHGGQVLVSETTAALLDGSGLVDLGPHRLKDMLEPIRLYQLDIEGLPDEFPPLRSLHRTNLPVAAWPLLGREGELDAIRRLLGNGARLVTLTGPGGSGKTRLALQAAAELSDEYPDGVFFVALAPLRDLSAVTGTVAEAVGLQPDDDVAAWLASRRVLLVADNLEHLQGVGAVVTQLLVGDTTILATSRAPLRLASERELPVEPLPEDAGIELFVSRAAAAGRKVEADETVAEVCRRLDNLPLALELAAARSKLLSPTALLQRLDAALPLLAGDADDRPERQRTLRATIQWSHDLLDSDTQAAFRRLCVFRGSFTLDAAEAITEADLDQIATLLDQSLLKPLGDDRFFQLETIREYARERLDDAGETSKYALRHARYYLERLTVNEAGYDSPRREELLVWYGEEEDNFRAMLDRLIAAAPDEAAVAGPLLRRYWVGHLAYVEAQDRLHALLGLEGLRSEARGRLLASLSEVEERLGHLDAAEAAGQEALELGEVTGHERLLFEARRWLAWNADRRGDREGAARLMRDALEGAESVDERCTALALHDLGVFLVSVGRTDEARETLQRAAQAARAIDYQQLEIDSMIDLAEIDLYQHDFDSAYRVHMSALGRLRGRAELTPNYALMMGWTALGVDHRDEARGLFAEAFSRMLAARATSHTEFARALAGIALAADLAAPRQAARLYGAAAGLRERSDFDLIADDQELESYFQQPLIQALGQEAWDREQAVGANMTLEDTIELARQLAGAT
jgi:predicted ATPase/class 3 adenylate cyclase